MLIARGALNIRAAELRWSLAFTRKLWFLVTERRGLVVDTRFLPAASEGRRSTALLYLLIRGAFLLHPATRFEGPCAFMLSREHLFGAQGERPVTYRATGEPYAAIEVHGSIDDFEMTSSVPVRIDLDAGTLQAAKQIIAKGFDADDALVRHLTDLILGLSDAALIARHARTGALLRTPWVFQRLWSAFRPMVEGFATSSKIEEVSSRAGVSTRQANRDVSSFFEVFGLPGSGWRPVSHYIRIKLAVLLLSAEGITVGEVASAVGYGSVAAMARAFRDARILPATEIQRALREAP